jgi:hypothetical protein
MARLERNLRGGRGGSVGARRKGQWWAVKGRARCMHGRRVHGKRVLPSCQGRGGRSGSVA